MLYGLLIFSVIIFAMSMGASNLAPSFANMYGARLIKHRPAVLWFTLFIFLGAVLGGQNVAKTLGTKFIRPELISLEVVVAILLAAVSGLIIANLLRVPESTSWTTVFAISGVGLALGNLQYDIILRIIPFWLILPAVGFGLTYFLYQKIYPPRQENLWLYEQIFNREKRLRQLVFGVSCYLAFAAGTNNVANAVGPLAGGGFLTIAQGLMAVPVFFGLGGLLLGKKMMATVGQDIVPLGLVSASLVGLVTATLLVFASAMGMPQSLVQLSALSIMAVAAVKHQRHIFHEKTVRIIFLAWLITPAISFILGYFFATILAG